MIGLLLRWFHPDWTRVSLDTAIDCPDEISTVDETPEQALERNEGGACALHVAPSPDDPCDLCWHEFAAHQPLPTWGNRP